MTQMQYPGLTVHPHLMATTDTVILFDQGVRAPGKAPSRRKKSQQQQQQKQQQQLHSLVTWQCLQQC